MHQHPPKTPLCFPTRRAKAGHVFGERDFEVRGMIEAEGIALDEAQQKTFGDVERSCGALDPQWGSSAATSAV